MHEYGSLRVCLSLDSLFLCVLSRICALALFSALSNLAKALCLSRMSHTHASHACLTYVSLFLTLSLSGIVLAANAGPRVPSGGVTLKRRCTYRPPVIYLIVNKLPSLTLSLSRAHALCLRISSAHTLAYTHSLAHTHTNTHTHTRKCTSLARTGSVYSAYIAAAPSPPMPQCLATHASSATHGGALGFRV